MTPRISVLIAAYNAADTMDGALGSLVGQTQPAHQIVVVDDASTDDTTERVRRWQELLPITLIERTANGGAGAARADGFAAVTGEQVAIFDADDVLFPNHLEQLGALASEDRVVAGQPLFWSPSSGVSDVATWDPIPPAEQQVERILSLNFMPAGSMIPIAALRRGVPPSTRRKAQDWDIWIDLIVRERLEAVMVDQPTYLYRVAESSLDAWQSTVEHEIEIYETLLGDPQVAEHRSQVETELRRRRARRAWIAGNAAAIDGDRSAARRHFLRAAWIDRSFRRPLSTAASGSVTLRAIAGVVSPDLSVRARTAHLRRKGMIE